MLALACSSGGAKADVRTVQMFIEDCNPSNWRDDCDQQMGLIFLLLTVEEGGVNKTVCVPVDNQASGWLHVFNPLVEWFNVHPEFLAYPTSEGFFQAYRGVYPC